MKYLKELKKINPALAATVEIKYNEKNEDLIKAKEIADKFCPLYPENEKLAFRAGQLYQDLKDYETAFNTHAACAEKNLMDTQNHYEAAKMAIKTNKSLDKGLIFLERYNKTACDISDDINLGKDSAYWQMGQIMS